MTHPSELAKRTSILIGAIEVDGFMLADGSYRMSQTQAAEIVGLPEINARRFLTSKAIESLLGKGYTPDSIEAESAPGKRGQTRFNALPLDVVTAYWFHQAFQGNKDALKLIWALVTESLDRRFDAAFGVQRSETEYNQRLTQRLEQLEEDLKESMDYESVAQYELRYVRDWLKQQGLDPWELPGGDEEEVDRSP